MVTYSRNFNISKGLVIIGDIEFWYGRTTLSATLTQKAMWHNCLAGFSVTYSLMLLGKQLGY